MGPVVLAMMTGAPIGPTTIYRHKGDTCLITVRLLLKMVCTGNREGHPGQQDCLLRSAGALHPHGSRPVGLDARQVEEVGEVAELARGRFAMRLKFALLILAPFLLLDLAGCQKEEPPRVAEDEFQNAPEQIIENMEVTFTEQGRRTGVLRADSVAIYQQGRVKQGKKIQVDFYDQQGQHVSILTADEGTYDSKMEEVEARGDVVVISDAGVRLETDVLCWRKQTNRIFTDAFVKITRGKDTVSGYGLDTDPQLVDLHIQRDLRGRIEDIQEITE